MHNIDSGHLARRAPADHWIDELDELKPDKFTYMSTNIDIPMQMLIQQGLPKITIEIFDGAPEDWIDFVEKFHDMVHNIPYLTIIQKKAYLLQHLKGEPLKAIYGFGNDRKGYIMSLKRLKYMFGNHALVAQTTIRKLTKGKQIGDNDTAGLTDFYYNLSQCLNTLQKMQYHSDIHDAFHRKESKEVNTNEGSNKRVNVTKKPAEEVDKKGQTSKEKNQVKSDSLWFYY